MDDEKPDQEMEAALERFFAGKMAEGMTPYEVLARALEIINATRRTFVAERRLWAPEIPTDERLAGVRTEHL
jgi:hypothetical protein